MLKMPFFGGYVSSLEGIMKPMMGESHNCFPGILYGSSEEALDERSSETAWFNTQEERVMKPY